MWNDKFVVRAEHDGTFVNCSVGLSRSPVPVVSQAAMLTVRCKHSHSLTVLMTMNMHGCKGDRKK